MLRYQGNLGPRMYREAYRAKPLMSKANTTLPGFVLGLVSVKFKGDISTLSTMYAIRLGGRLYDCSDRFNTLKSLVKTLTTTHILVRIAWAPTKQWQWRSLFGPLFPNLSTTFTWISQTVAVLHQIDHVLSDTVEAWRSFDSPGGDITYFRNTEESHGISSYSRCSLRAIKATFRELECHQK